MILALLLAVVGFILAVALPAPACLAALLVVGPCVWLMCGGGERWHERRDARCRARLP